MSKNNQFTSVWDTVEDDPVRQENLKLRSALMMEIAERIKNQGLTQPRLPRCYISPNPGSAPF